MSKKKDKDMTAADAEFYTHLQEWVDKKRRLLTLPERLRAQKESGLLNLNTGCGWCLLEMVIKCLKAFNERRADSGETQTEG